MPQRFTIGDREFTLRPRSHNLDLSLSGDASPRAALRDVRMERLRTAVLRESAERRLIEQARTGKAPDLALIEELTAEIRGHDARLEEIDNEEGAAMLRFAAVVLHDKDGDGPDEGALRDVDFQVIEDVVNAVAGVPPTEAEE